jgi:hypothetical protein
MASSLVDEELQAYRDCMLALTTCDWPSLQVCIALLPVDF